LRDTVDEGDAAPVSSSSLTAASTSAAAASCADGVTSSHGFLAQTPPPPAPIRLKGLSVGRGLAGGLVLSKKSGNVEGVRTNRQQLRAGGRDAIASRALVSGGVKDIRPAAL
jgi:hypothetical protein